NVRRVESPINPAQRKRDLPRRFDRYFFFRIFSEQMLPQTHIALFAAHENPVAGLFDDNFSAMKRSRTVGGSTHKDFRGPGIRSLNVDETVDALDVDARARFEIE